MQIQSLDEIQLTWVSKRLMDGVHFMKRESVNSIIESAENVLQL